MSTMTPPRPSSRVAGWTAHAVLFGAVVLFALAVHAHYPIQHWLFWRYACYWLLAFLFSFACLSAGCRIVAAVSRSSLPETEFLLTSFAAGVLAFVLGMIAAGWLGGFSAAFAVAWPIVLAALGARRAWRSVVGVARTFSRGRPIHPARMAVAAFGLVGAGMIYFTILTPENVGFDARWYHLPIAEHYAAAGRIVPFEEGWYIGAYPHLASFVYLWAFLLPWTELFDRVLIAAHLEFVFFLATAASIPLLVRRLVGGPFRFESFAAMFLLPGLFLYDGSLFVAADHILAFWAIPIYLSLVRLARDPSPRRFAMTALLFSAAVLTKYQAVYFLAAAAGASAIGLVRAARKGTRSAAELAWGPALALVVGAVLTAPHWLPNWWWYGDPVYPFLHAHLDDGSWTAGTLRRLDTFFGGDKWTLAGPISSRVTQTARALVTFSFEPHDWPSYHGKVPVFGSLFTLLSLVLPFLRGARRTAALVLATLAGVALWFSTSHQDRYLQCLVPWMAAATAALVLLIWRHSRSLRVPLVLAVALQIVWGGDVYFMRPNDDSYEVDRPSPVHAVADLLSSGHRGDYESRLHPFAPWESIGAALPRDAKVLVHERYLHLGLGRMSVSDLPGWQGRISYEDRLTPKAIAREMRRLGVTHLLWETDTSHESDSFAGDLAFYRYVSLATADKRTVGPFTLATLAREPLEDDPGKVGWYECPASNGELFSLEAVAAEEFDGLPIPPIDADSVPPAEASFVVLNRACHEALPAPGWTLGANRGHYAMWIRAVGDEADERHAEAEPVHPIATPISPSRH